MLVELNRAHPLSFSRSRTSLALRDLESPPPPPPPPLMDVDDIVEEILRRLPPDDPASLARAALVCKRWYRLVTDPHFRHRFRRFHRSAPMLGFCDGAISNGRFFVSTSTTSFRPPSRRVGRDFVRDARHGRVLLHELRPGRTSFVSLVVWDPITNKQRQLPDLPRQWLQHDTFNWNAAVLCAATADRTCDHLECHHGHFLVVFVSSKSELVWSCVYSSKSGARSKHSSAQLGGCGGVCLGPCALVESALYFDTPDKSILKYDLGTNEMSLIGVPSECWYSRILVPTAMEDGGLGFACVKCNQLHIWSRVIAPEGWAQRRVIDLDTLLHANAYSTPMVVAGFAGSVCVIFVHTHGACFMINLNSNRVTKLCRDFNVYGIFPYISFCTPGGCGEDDDGNDIA